MSATPVPVMITLTDQIAPQDLDRRPTEILRELRRTADDSQGSVRAKLRGPARSFWLVNAVGTSIDARELAALRRDPAVAAIDLDPKVTVAGTTTGSGQESWGIGAVRAPEVWSQYGVTGTGMRIGSIDTGVDPSNPELAGAIAGWRDFVGGQPTPYDDNGHGSHTIGTMVARNITGAKIGVAPGASVIVAKAMSADGSASGSTLLAAAQWMTDPDGDPATADYPTVINNSWTAAGANNEWFRPMIQTWVAMGIAPVFGAGNTAGSIGNPASYPESIAVGQLEQSGVISVNSSRGVIDWTAPDGTPFQVGKPDLTAPGVFISSTVGAGYGLYSGSSMAAPHVAAAIALIRQVRPDLTVDGVRQLLAATANDRGVPGFDTDYGAGALDIAAAMATTGAPVIVPVVTAPVVAVPTAVTVTPTKVKLLRVVRRGGHLTVQGRISGPARLRVAMRPRGKSQNALRAVTASRTMGGRFSVRIPVGRLPRRTYTLVVTASNAAGTRLGSTSLQFRLR